MKDPIEVQPLGGDRVLIVLRAEESGDSISSTPRDDLPLDLDRGPAIETLVSESPNIYITGSTHVT